MKTQFHALSGALGLEDFCYALYDDRDWLEAAMGDNPKETEGGSAGVFAGFA